MTYQPPVPTRASKRQVSAHAERQREVAGISSGFDLANLVQRIGGTIDYISAFDEDQIDAILVEPDGIFRILLSSHTGARRDNFTVAHELGHFLLHWPKVREANPGDGMRATRDVDESNPDLVRCEWEANWFAAAFLMPEVGFRTSIVLGEEHTADLFGVSVSAVKVRCRSLGISE